MRSGKTSAINTINWSPMRCGPRQVESLAMVIERAGIAVFCFRPAPKRLGARAVFRLEKT